MEKQFAVKGQSLSYDSVTPKPLLTLSQPSNI